MLQQICFDLNGIFQVVMFPNLSKTSTCAITSRMDYKKKIKILNIELVEVVTTDLSITNSSKLATTHYYV